MPRGRKPGFRMTDEHRSKIRSAQILNALQEHVEGKREMSPTQVTAGLGLLKKVLPDLAAVEHSGTVEMRPATDMTDDELAAIAAGGGDGVAEPPPGPRLTH